MRWLPIGVVALSACATAPPVVSPVDPAAAAREVERLERDYHRAIATGDRARQLELLAPDYRLVTPFGHTLDRDAVLADLCQFEFVSLPQDLRVAVSGNSDAIVTMVALAVHTKHKVERELRTLRVWSRRDGRWVATLAQQTSLPGTPPNAAAAGRTTAEGPVGAECGWR